MNDERMQSLLDTWYRDREVPRPKVQTSVAKVMANVPQIRQRGRWWPLPPFDRPRSTFPSRELAPAPIPVTNGHAPARGFTMFSALKFMTAGVIVALFGGYLLAGVLTTQQGDEALPAAVTGSAAPEATGEATGSPDPSISTDILPGVTLSIEEVEPGVYRVVNDGVRDLAKANDFDIVAGHDGGIWLLRPKWFFRLGTQGAHDWPTKTPKHAEFEVTPDGTVWVQAEGALQSFDGENWTTHFEEGGYGGIEVTSDGTVWATWDDPETYRAEHWEIYKKVSDLRSFLWGEIGKSFVYMDFMHPHIDWGKQRERVGQFAFLLATEFHNRHDDTEENRLWWRKLTYKFLDEVENQC